MLAAYDEAILSEKDLLDQARHLATRLAEPLRLSQAHATAFRAVLEPAAQSACLHFGARSRWDDIERLFDAKALDAAHIPRLVSTFNRFGNTLASGFMLDLKARRFGRTRASYDI